MVRNKGRRVAKRPLNRRLSLVQRGTAIGMSEMGANPYGISEKLNCAPKSIRELKKKVKKHNTLLDLPRTGRPKKTSPREDRSIKFNSLQNRRLTAKAMAIKQCPTFIKNKVSCSLVKRRLKDAGLPARIARKKPLLSVKNRKARYQWAKEHIDLTEEDWKKVIFSDESPFTLFQWAGKQYVRRRPGEEFKDECLVPTVKHGGGKIQVWGCFSWQGAGPLYRVKGLMDGKQYREILKNHMAPYLKKYEEEMKCEVVFQHDNDPKHTSKVVKNYLKNKSIAVLNWASQSPDMNPMEHAWKYLKDQVTARSDKASNLDEVFTIAQEEWKNISVEFFRKLILSMTTRVQTVYNVRGRHTKY
jgi:hypothetical protein